MIETVAKWRPFSVENKFIFTIVKEAFQAKMKSIHKRGNRYLLAISGGVDSMVLFHLFQQSNYDFTVAHCNFQLRDNAKKEQAFVVETCNKFGIDCYTQTFDVQQQMNQTNESVQMAARSLRYDWFNTLRKKHRFSHIVTAHHLNDQLETVLLNFAKGTGIRGLVGMKETADQLLKPLLAHTKEEIYKFADDQSIHYLEDESNRENKYQRNFIRNEIIPLFKRINPNLEANFQQTNENLQFTEWLANQSLQRQTNKLLGTVNQQRFIHLLRLFRMPFASNLFYELVKEYDFTAKQAAEIYSSLPNSKNGAEYKSHSTRLIKDRNRLFIAKLADDTPATIPVFQTDESVQIGQQTLTFQHLEQLEDFSTNSSIIQVPLKQLQFPLLIRKWLPGDYFYPFGLGKKQKLKKYFINNRFSKLDKENTNLLISGNKIVWVIGHRLDNRFAVTNNDEPIVKIEVQTNQTINL